ncbi:MAG: histidine kinase [Bacteroidia bacterium]|nr:histidine kinase [Bacteroidia bacterium]
MKMLNKNIYLIGFLLGLLFTKAQNNKDLVMHFSFNQGIVQNDVSGKKGKAYGVELTEDRFGNSDKAFYFQGMSGSFLNLGNEAELKPKEGTLSLWFNPQVLISLGKGVETNPIITTSSNNSDECNQAFYIGIDLNTRKLNGSTVNSCTEASTLYSKGKVTFGKWHHAVLTYNDHEITLFLDNEFQYKASKNFQSKFLKGDSIIIGSFCKGSNARYFLGCIDDIRIYNKVLTTNEIKELYEEPNPVWIRNVIIFLTYLILTVFVFVILVWLIKHRIKRAVKLEQEKNELRNHALALENKVLAAQMDPHFIFNSLNGIQQFIILNENEKAQLYLTKFSRLIRKMLETNLKDSKFLSEEVEILTRYLEIESLRFNNVFKYKITIAEPIEVEKIQIPNFLIQPLVENAIWHGLLPKEGDKKLNIIFESIDENTLSCIVEDNGVGRKKARNTQKQGRDKSLALNFIEQRLELMSKMRNANYGITIIDKVNAKNESEGTKVKINIPIIKE